MSEQPASGMKDSDLASFRSDLTMAGEDLVNPLASVRAMLEFADDGGAESLTPARCLMRFRNRANRLFPKVEREFQGPDGPWRTNGCDIPNELLDLQVEITEDGVNVTRKNRKQAATMCFDYLRACVTWYQKAADAAEKKKAFSCIEWALRAGFHPNRYSKPVTPVGQAAMGGDARLVALMHRFGANLVMRIKPEHMDEIMPSSSLGSTLLHRIVRREAAASTDERADKLLGVVEYLCQALPTEVLLMQNEEGVRADKMEPAARGCMRVAQEIARRQKMSLEAGLDDKPAVARQRL